MTKNYQKSTQALIDKLVLKAEALELEAVAKAHIHPDTPNKEARQKEGVFARNSAKQLRSKIQTLIASLHF